MNEITIYPTRTRARVSKENFITGLLSVDHNGYLVDGLTYLYVLGVQEKSGEGVFCISYFPPGSEGPCFI